MQENDILREQLLVLLGEGNAHNRLEEIAREFPLEAINRQAGGQGYTPWRLLEHIRIAQWDILEFIRNPRHVSPPWPEGYWPPRGEQADRIRWEQSLAGFQSDLAALAALVADPANDLLAPLPHAPGYTLLREVLTAADHNAYHTGEFGLLRDLVAG